MEIDPASDSGSSFSFEGFLTWTVVAAVWIYYLIFFNTRLWGFVVTLILRKIDTGADVRVGSFTLSILAGKVLFRDVRYVTTDFSLRIVDGVVIYRWWKRFSFEQDYSQQDPAPDRDNESKDGIRCTWQSSLDCPVKVVLNGFEMRVYNRTCLYSKVESVFNKILRPGNESDDEVSDDGVVTFSTGNEMWRQLVPALHFHISSGRVVFGNRLVPYTVSLHFESGSGLYTTSLAESQFDPFRHVVKMNCKDVQVKLSESEGYSSDRKEDAPRHMGTGFCVMKTMSVKFNYIWDEPGLVMSNWEAVDDDVPPRWRLSIKLGQKTDIMHGPWVVRQRLFLQQFLFPVDYQKAQITKKPVPGMKRAYEAFDIDVQVTQKTMLNELFSNRDGVNFLWYASFDQGSNMRFRLPWIVDEKGYDFTLNMCLKDVDIFTSLEYRPMAKVKEINISSKHSFPRVWNQTQDWELNITASKATIRFLYAHVPFFQVLLEDWSAGYSADLLRFFPMAIKLNATISDFELLCYVNSFNWLDTAPATHTEKENAMLAVCGQQLTFATFFPLTEFQPRLQTVSYNIQGEKLVLRLRVPESCGSHSSIQALIDSNKQRFTSEEEVWLQNRRRYSSPSGGVEEQDGEEEIDLFPETQSTSDDVTWKRDTVVEDGWFDCWFAQTVSLQIVYTTHPAVVYEDSVLLEDAPQGNVSPLSSDVSDMEWSEEPDHMDVHINVYNSNIRLFGSIVKHILNFKNNYFGVYQPYHIFDSSELGKHKRGLRDVIREAQDKRPYRTNFLSPDSTSTTHTKLRENYIERQLEVVFSLTAHDNTAQLPVYVGIHGPQRHLPVLKVSSLNLEFKKGVEDGRLTINLSPVRCFMSDPAQSMLEQGYLFMSDLQMLGHGLYSDCGSAVVEYGWFIELKISDVTTEMSTSDARMFTDWLDTFVFHLMDDEGDLQAVVGEEEATDALCGIDVHQLEQTPNETPTIKQLKYSFTRVSISHVHLRLLDGECCTALRIGDLFVSKCNLHSTNCTSGMTAVIHDIRVSQLVTDQLMGNLTERRKPTVASRLQSTFMKDDVWREIGCVVVPEVSVDVSERHPALASLLEIQQLFLRHHDRPYKRLWFLWKDEDLVPIGRVECGCYGGCQFFDTTRPPALSVRRSSEVAKGDTARKFGVNLRNVRSVSVPRTAFVREPGPIRKAGRSESFPSLLSPLGNNPDGPLKLGRMKSVTGQSSTGSRPVSRAVSFAESFYSCVEKTNDFLLSRSQTASSTDSFVSARDFHEFQETLTTPVSKSPLLASPEGPGPVGLENQPISSDTLTLYPKYARRKCGRKRRTGVVSVAASPQAMARAVSANSIAETPLLEFVRMEGETQRLPRLDVIASRHTAFTKTKSKSPREEKEYDDNEERAEASNDGGEDVCIAVRVENVDARISPLCVEVAARHVDCWRRYGQHLHPLRVVDILHDRVLVAVRSAAMNSPPDRLLAGEQQGNQTCETDCDVFRKQRPPTVTVSVYVDSATVVAVHDHDDCQPRGALQSKPSGVVPIAAAAIGGVRCDILRRPDVPSRSRVESSSPSDRVVISSSVAYIHCQLSAFESIRSEVCTESRVAFEITAENGVEYDASTAMPLSNRPTILLEGGGDGFTLKAVFSFPSCQTINLNQADCGAVEGQMCGELNCLWGSLILPRGKSRRSLSETSDCDVNVVATATAVCQQWKDRGDRLKQSIKKLIATENERLANVLRCLLVDSLLDSATKSVCASMVQPMAFVLHQSEAVQLISLLRHHASKVGIEQLERHIQQCSWSTSEDTYDSMKAVAYVWGEKLRRRSNHSPSGNVTRHVSAFSLPTDVTPTVNGNEATVSTPEDGSSLPVAGVGSVDTGFLSNSSSFSGTVTDSPPLLRAHRSDRPRSSRLSFYSLFSNRRQFSRVERLRSGPSSALDEMDRMQDVLGYAKNLLLQQNSEAMQQTQVAFRPLFSVVGMRSRHGDDGRSLLVEANCTAKQILLLAPITPASQPPCSADQLNIGVCLKASPGRKASGRPSLLDGFVNVRIQSIRQHTTMPLLAEFRRMMTLVRDIGAAEFHGRKEEATELNIADELQPPRDDVVSDLMRSLVQAMLTKERASGEPQDDGRGDGDGSPEEALRGPAIAAEVTINIDQSQLECTSIASEMPLLKSHSSSPVEGLVPLRPVGVSNPLLSVSGSPLSLSASGLIMDSVAFRQPPRGSAASSSGLTPPSHHLHPSTDDDTRTDIQTAPPPVRPLGVRGEGVGESIHNLDSVGVQEERDNDWQDIARSVKITSRTDSYSCISVAVKLHYLSVEVAVDAVSAGVEIRDVQSTTTIKTNKEREERSLADGDRVHVLETVSFSGLVPSLALTVADRLNTKGEGLVCGGMRDVKVVVTNVMNGKWKQTVVGVDAIGLDVNFQQSVVALHSAINRSFPMLNKEAQSMMMSMADECGYDEIDSPVMDSKIHSKVILEGRVEAISVSAVLLPSLSASYRMERLLFGVNAEEVTSFTIGVINQQLQFKSKVEVEMGMLESMGLPNIDVAGQLTDVSVAETSSSSEEPETPIERHLQRVDVDVDIDDIVMTLTTDMVKLLAAIQSKFVRETTDLLKDVSNIGLLLEAESAVGDDADVKTDFRLFRVHLRLQRIQVVATTPTLTELRLHTGEINMTVSNDATQSVKSKSANNLLLGAVSVDLKVSLGSHLPTDSCSFEEGHFREMAYVNACIHVKGSEDDTQIKTHSVSEKRTLSIEIRQPHLFMQPLAFDKGVLLWLKYKEAFDYWQEQQKTVSSEMRDLQTAAGAVMDRWQGQAPLRGPTPSKQTEKPGSPFQSLRIKLEDLGLAMPIFAHVSSSLSLQDQDGPIPVVHLVTTVQSARLAIMFGSAAEPSLSVGEFKGFTVRMDPNFDEETNQWALSQDKTVNLGLVPRGHYRVFVQTEATQDDVDEEGHLTVELKWHMHGISVVLDRRIGGYLSALIATMTALSLEEEYDSEGESENENAAEAASGEEAERSQRVDAVEPNSTEVCVESAPAELSAVPTVNPVKGDRSSLTTPSKKPSYHKRTSSFAKDYEFIALQRQLQNETQALQALQSSSASHHVIHQQQNVIGSLESSLSIVKKARETADANPTPSTAFELTESWGFVLKQSSTSQAQSDTVDGKERRRGAFLGSRLGVPRPSVTDVSEESIDGESATGSLPRKVMSDASLNSGTAQSAESASTSLAFKIDLNVTIASGSCLLLPVNVADLPEDQRRHVLGQRIETVTNLQSYLSVSQPDGEKKRSISLSLPQTPGRGALGRRSTDSDLTRQDSTEVYIPGLLLQAHYHTETEQLAVPSCMSATSLSSVDESTPGSSSSMSRKKSVRQINGSGTGKMARLQKRGKLYVKLSVQSLPEQTIIRSSLLSFLEANMEPVIVSVANNTVQDSTTETDQGTDHDESRRKAKLETSSESNATSGVSVSSFPVDVTLLLDIERQRIKLSGEPRSRLECLVRTPAIYLIMSSALLERDKARISEHSPLTTSDTHSSSSPREVTLKMSRHLINTSPQSTVCVSGHLSNFSVVLYHPLSEKVEATPDLRRRASNISGSSFVLGGESLNGIINLQLSSLQFNLSRRQTQDTTYFRHLLNTSTHDPNNLSSILISAVGEMNSINLKYDMRRTSDVDSFTKAWSNPTLFKKLVYGSSDNSREEETLRDRTPTPIADEANEQVLPTMKLWQSCISFALKVTALNIQSYIGPVMGQTSIRAGPLDCFGSVTVDSQKRRSVHSNVRLKRLSADSKSGAVGGLVNVQMAETATYVVTGRDCRVLHRIGGSMNSIRVRIDHLNSPVLMARLTSLGLNMTDTWLAAVSSGGCDVELLVNVRWEDLEILISSSTSPDLVDSVRRIRQFIHQQKMNSRRTLRDLVSGQARLPQTQPTLIPERPSDSSIQTDYTKHDHWSWVEDVQKFVCSFLGLDERQYPRLGGILVLEGDRFGLACLKGSSFRDSTWALFVLRKIQVRYETVTIRGERALAIAEESEVKFQSPPTAVSLQVFNIGLGNDKNKSEILLMVEKVSRSRIPPLAVNKSIDEWLNLVCRKESTTQPPANRSGIAPSAFDSQTIFAGPSFDLELSTTQYWPQCMDEALRQVEMPTVECRLTSSFRDSLSAATDVDLYLFLHDLIISYRTELTAAMQPGSRASPARDTVTLGEEDTLRLRKFVCTSWQLNPHLKLLFWGGSGHFNPHINWVLEKLGFKDARTTIPKWLQRGLLDPLDLTVASILKQIVNEVSSELMSRQGKTAEVT